MGNTNQVRIIGGKFKGKKISFPSTEGLRPSPDRIRETLFNWLSPVIHDAACLDLFAGSGILGFEALSRGAQHVSFVDNNSDVIKQLLSVQKELDCSNLDMTRQNSLDFLKRTNLPRYHVVFLDPPFSSNLLEPCIKLLDENSLLADEAFVYIEMPKKKPLPIIPYHWNLYREKQAGQIRYALYWLSKQTAPHSVLPGAIPD